MPLARVVLALALTSLIPQTSPATNFDVQKLSDRVYAVVRKDPPGLMVDANNAFIIGDDAVVVVDSNGAPAITREVLKALRAITSKPVKFVVNTHYHDDHIRGNQVYLDAFPGVRIVGHPFTRDYLPNQGATNRKGFLEGAPTFVDEIRGLLKEGKNLNGGPLTEEERVSLSNDVQLADFVLRESASVGAVLPDTTVPDRQRLDLRGVDVDVIHPGAGHTAADLIVHLPADGIVIAGDLVVWPVPLVGDPQSHIGSWSQALEKIRLLKPRAIVPGHGPVLKDDLYLATLASMFASIRKQADDAVAAGATLDETRKRIRLDDYRSKLAGESPVRNLLFTNYVLRPAVGAAFAEASTRR